MFLLPLPLSLLPSCSSLQSSLDQVSLDAVALRLLSLLSRRHLRDCHETGVDSDPDYYLFSDFVCGSQVGRARERMEGETKIYFDLQGGSNVV